MSAQGETKSGLEHAKMDRRWQRRRLTAQWAMMAAARPRQFRRRLVARWATMAAAKCGGLAASGWRFHQRRRRRRLVAWRCLGGSGQPDGQRRRRQCPQQGKGGLWAGTANGGGKGDCWDVGPFGSSATSCSEPEQRWTGLSYSGAAPREAARSGRSRLGMFWRGCARSTSERGRRPGKISMRGPAFGTATRNGTL